MKIFTRDVPVNKKELIKFLKSSASEYRSIFSKDFSTLGDGAFFHSIEDHVCEKIDLMKSCIYEQKRPD